MLDDSIVRGGPSWTWIRILRIVSPTITLPGGIVTVLSSYYFARRAQEETRRADAEAQKAQQEALLRQAAEAEVTGPQGPAGPGADPAPFPPSSPSERQRQRTPITALTARPLVPGYAGASIFWVTTRVTPHPASHAECRPSPPATTTTMSSTLGAMGTIVAGFVSSIQSG